MRRHATWLAQGLVAAAIAAQMLVRALLPPPAVAAEPVPPAPASAWLRAASLGEPEVLSRLLMLRVQTFDQGHSWRTLDYTALAAWLDRALDLDPRGQAPLLAAVDVYGAVHDPARVRTMLDWVERRFSEDPGRRWPWLAQAALLARHRLHDPALALRYAQALRRHASGPQVPPWVAALEPVLDREAERDATGIVAGGLLATGQVRDGALLQSLERRLRRTEHAVSTTSEPLPCIP